MALKLARGYASKRWLTKPNPPDSAGCVIQHATGLIQALRITRQGILHWNQELAHDGCRSAQDAERQSGSEEQDMDAASGLVGKVYKELCFVP